MTLERKLARLGSAPPVASAPAAAPADIEAPPGDRRATLDDLRDKMAAIVGKERPVPAVRGDPAATALPFSRCESPHGPLCQRLERLRASHHVGRIAVDAAHAASSEVLALLALDPGLGAVDPRGALFFDTETTGLGGSGSIAFLVGLASFDADGRLEVEQLFVRTPAEEPAMLRRLAERIRAASLLVTFNGKAFDWPLIAARYVMNRLPAPPGPPHLDLVHVARRLHRKRIRRCTLKSVEAEVLGFERDGDIDGGDVAPRYAHFLRTGDESALAAVVQHNFWDVISMAALVGLYGEPVGVLHEGDLVGLARTFQRARALDAAQRVADVAVERGAGAEALRVRARIAKARGDKTRALADFEALSREVDDPSVRLELSKLYEHHVKEPLCALEVVEQGTGESEEATLRRRRRLERKAARKR